MNDIEFEKLRFAAHTARSLRKSFPHGRIRLTPAVHEELAYALCEGTDQEPLAAIVQSFGGLRVEIDPDVPDPGWTVETWR